MINSRVLRIVLFDIDGTLIRCGGAGGASLRAAMRDEFGIGEVGPFELHGRTDLGIFNGLLSRHGIEPNEENRNRLSQRYFSLLPEQLVLREAEAQACVLPGVVDLLEHLRRDARHTVGLMTGNLPTSAQMKLDHFSLWNYFEFGIFGDLTDHRPHMAQPALDRIAKHQPIVEAAVPSGANANANTPPTTHSPHNVSRDAIVVVGDTTLDIELAQAMKARSLAVCTGGCNKGDLMGAGASLVLDDLSDTATILRWLESSASGTL